jgi:transposase
VDINLAVLPDDPATLRHLLHEVVAAAELKHTVLQSAVQERAAEIDKLQLLIKRLLRHQFGRRSEQLSPDQLQLGIAVLEQTLAANQAAKDADPAGDKQRQRREARPNRNHGALPAHLPRYEVLIDVEHRDCPCCGGVLPGFNQSSQRLCELTVGARQTPRQVFSSQGFCEASC